MALKDIYNYYLDMQDEYLEAIDNKAEMINEYKQGNIDNEQVEEFQKYFDDIEKNYHRLSYIMHLLNEPAKNTCTRKKKDNYNKNLKEFFIENKATKEDIKLENKFILEKLQEIVKRRKK